MGPGDYMYLINPLFRKKNPSLNTNLVEVPIFCRSYLREIKTPIELDVNFIPPLGPLYTELQMTESWQKNKHFYMIFWLERV